MLAFLAHSLLAMLVMPENLNPVRRGGGEEKKFTSSHVKCHIYCFVLTDLHIPYFQPHGNQTQLILANHESIFFLITNSSVRCPVLRQKVSVITLPMKTMTNFS